MVTLRDIAERCGVSTASVSKALNNKPGVGREKMEEILMTAREMGYMPNQAARSLKTNRSDNIGLFFAMENLSTVLKHEFISQIVCAIQKTAQDLGIDTTLLSQRGLSTAEQFSQRVGRGRYDGLILTSSAYREPGLMTVINSDIPVVTVDHLFPHRSAVSSENRQAMHDLVAYAASFGHKRVAFVHGEKSYATLERIKGYEEAMKTLWPRRPKSYLVPGIFHHPDTAAQAAQKLLALSPRPTCILFQDDYSAIGGMRALTEAGLSIPGDISIAGFDGINHVALTQPVLTTMVQDATQMGTLAVKLLLQEIADPDSPPEHVMLPVAPRPGETMGKAKD